MIRLITFTDVRMTFSADNLTRSVLANGIDEAYVYRYDDLDKRFMQMAEPTIYESKGAGLYIWKPYICWHAINRMKDGETLIYADAGQTIISSVQPVIDAMDQDVMMFSNGWNHMDWCKMDVMASILGRAVFPKVGEIKQAQASLIFFRVSSESRKFVKEWMLWCLMPGFCDNSPSVLPNVPTFQETRWDQSVLSCLGIKYGYKLHWFPSSTNWHNKSAHPNDNYPAIVDHHRRRNPGATNGTDSEW